MAYWQDIWRFQESNEYEYKYAGKYGAKGEKRQKRKRASPEQIRKQNQRNREKRMRRLIKGNFSKNDIWATLKYPKGTRKEIGEVKKDIATFLRKGRRCYQKQGEPFKYIYRLELGSRGGVHIHILFNRIQTRPGIDIVMQELWPHGRIHYESIYEDGGWQKLAEYIVKEPDEEIAGQLQLFPEGDRKDLCSYSSSRNLIRPEPERKEYKRMTMRKLMENGPTPTPGYYIDKGSIRQGTNQYTGMSYYQYTEIRLGDAGGLPWEGGGG